ncbi:MAG: hypothetical protein WB615_14920 [Candidatus Tumulicola sp.]
MTPSVETALRESLERAAIVDPELVNASCFADFVADVREQDGGVVGISEAVSKMRQKRPQWFRGWDDIADEDFARREAALREDTRKLTTSRHLEDFRALDAARLSDDEFSALETTLRRRSHETHEIARIKHAFARQHNEDTALKGARN